MICKVRQTIEAYRMLDACGRVIVGVSGGADSCALLHLLCGLQPEYGFTVTAAHVNHGIRGEEALRDEDFVRQFCRSLGAELKLLHCDVPAGAAECGMGTEEYGRKVRYEFFSSLDGTAKIATAHTLSDCCETLLFHIARGTGTRGLCAIPPVRGRVIRPLIACTREETEAYCRENGIDYVTDSTNADTAYARNRIRQFVIPELKNINPSFEQAGARLIDAAREDTAYFDSAVNEILRAAACENGYKAARLLALPQALQTRAAAEILRENGVCSPQAKHIAAVCAILGGGKTQLPGGKTFVCKNGVLRTDTPAETLAWQREFLPDQPIITPKKTLKTQFVHKNAQGNIQFVHKNVLDFDRTVGQLVFRSRQPGDQIRIAGRNCTKTVKKLFTEAKIEDKNAVVLLCDAQGPVWIDGFGCAERCKTDENTKTILKILDGEDL